MDRSKLNMQGASVVGAKEASNDMKAAHPTGRIVAVLTQNKSGTQVTYEEKSRVADRIVQRFRETGFQCKLRWFDLPSQCP
jgi:hypothetical protein